MKEKITAFINHLLVYDYILFGSAFALFLLFIILAILLRNRLGVALFFVLFGFSTLLLAPSFGYIQMHKYLFKNTTELISYKQLSFVPAVVVKGKLTNDSKFNFKECKVTATVYKYTSNKLKNYVYKLKPFKKSSMLVRNIERNSTQEFKFIVEPFSYSKDYNITLGASCR